MECLNGCHGTGIALCAVTMVGIPEDSLGLEGSRGQVPYVRELTPIIHPCFEEIVRKLIKKKITNHMKGQEMHTKCASPSHALHPNISHQC